MKNQNVFLILLLAFCFCWNDAMAQTETHIQNIDGSTDLFIENTDASGSTGLYLRSDLNNSYISNRNNFVGNGTTLNNDLIINSEHKIRLQTGNTGVGNTGNENFVIDETGSIFTGGSNIELNYYSSGDRNSFIDFHSDDVNTDWSARIIRTLGENGGLAFQNRLGDHAFYTNTNVFRMVIKDNGNVGIGEPNPNQKLVVNGNIWFGNTVSEGHIFNIDRIVGFNDIRFYADDNVLPNEPNLIIKTNGEVQVRDKLVVTGSDFAERFHVNTTEATEVEALKGMLVVIDETKEGQLTPCTRAYDKKVAGIVSGAGGVSTGLVMGEPNTLADGDIPVAMTGRVYCYADASYGAIEVGDMLTTSQTEGHAMRVKKHKKAVGSIVGKALTTLDEGTGLVLVLLTLQ